MYKIINDNVKLLNNLAMLKKVVEDLNACINKNCKNEKDNMMKNKDNIRVKSLFQDFINKKITIQEFIKKGSDLKKKIEKSKENKAIVKCQLNKCYSETKRGVDVAIDKILEYSPKDSMSYKFATEYNKKLRNKKLTDVMIKNINKKLREIQSSEQKKKTK